MGRVLHVDAVPLFSFWVEFLSDSGRMMKNGNLFEQEKKSMAFYLGKTDHALIG